MKSWLKSHLNESWRRRIHRLSRLRWMTKAKIIRSNGLSLTEHWRFILFDPEVESYTYRVANMEEMLAAIADTTGVAVQQLRAYVAEADADPELGERLAKRVGWRLDVKRRPQLANRLGWYVLVRALRPKLLIETGIYHGLGSLALLRALERNAAEGSPGELFSFDLASDAGWLVEESRYPNWHRVVGSTADLLEKEIAGRHVGALFHDSYHDVATQQLEFGVALANPEPALLLVDASGGQIPVLEELARKRDGEYRQVPLGASDHWYQRGALTFAVFRAPGDG
jgi:hypothetical protein